MQNQLFIKYLQENFNIRELKETANEEYNIYKIIKNDKARIIEEQCREENQS